MSKMTCIFVLSVFLHFETATGGENSRVVRQFSFGEIAEMAPVYSPNGRWIVFEYFHKVGKGFPQIWAMPVSGSFTEAKALVDDGNSNAEFCWAPDSKSIAYIKQIMNEDELKICDEKKMSNVQIWIVDLDSGEERQVSNFPVGFVFGNRLAWVATQNYIVFERNMDIYAISPGGGVAIKLVEMDTAGTSLNDVSWLSVSPDGSIFLFEGEDEIEETTSIWVLENKPTARPLKLTQGPHDGLPCWSPDSKYVAFSRATEEENINIFLSPIEQPDNIIQLTVSSSVDLAPSWHPSGNKIAFCRNLDYQEETHGSTIWENFHLWEIEVPSDIVSVIQKNLSASAQNQ